MDIRYTTGFNCFISSSIFEHTWVESDEVPLCSEKILTFRLVENLTFLCLGSFPKESSCSTMFGITLSACSGNNKLSDRTGGTGESLNERLKVGHSTPDLAWFPEALAQKTKLGSAFSKSCGQTWRVCFKTERYALPDLVFLWMADGVSSGWPKTSNLGVPRLSGA